MTDPSRDHGMSSSKTTLLIGSTLQCPDMYYLVGHLSSETWVYIEAEHDTIIVVEDGEAEAVRSRTGVGAVWTKGELGWLTEAVRLGSAESADLMVAVHALRRLGVSAVVVPGWLAVSRVAFLRDQGITVILDPDAVGRRRRRKDRVEVQKIESVLRKAEESMRYARSVIGSASLSREGVLQIDGRPLTAGALTDLVMTQWQATGCEGEEPLVCGGRETLLLEPDPSRPLRAGEPILLDLFPRDQTSRYFADITRVYCVGPPPEPLARLHAHIREAVELAKSRCRPGMVGSEVYSEVAAFIAQGPVDGIEPAPYLGHGLGLELHEFEVGVQPYSHQPLQAGNVLTIEPEGRAPSVGAVRLEDVVLITEDGCRTLTRLDYGLAP